MSAGTFTWALTGAVLLLVAIFDVWIIKKKGKRASISAHIIRGSKKMPLVVFLAGIIPGILIGHTLWSMDTFDWMDKEQLRSRCIELLEEEK